MAPLSIQFGPLHFHVYSCSIIMFSVYSWSRFTDETYTFNCNKHSRSAVCCNFVWLLFGLLLLFSPDDIFHLLVNSSMWRLVTSSVNCIFWQLYYEVSCITIQNIQEYSPIFPRIYNVIDGWTRAIVLDLFDDLAVCCVILIDSLYHLVRWCCILLSSSHYLIDLMLFQ